MKNLESRIEKCEKKLDACRPIEVVIRHCYQDSSYMDTEKHLEREDSAAKDRKIIKICVPDPASWGRLWEKNKGDKSWT